MVCLPICNLSIFMVGALLLVYAAFVNAETKSNSPNSSDQRIATILNIGTFR